jgi:adenosine deaminase
MPGAGLDKAGYIKTVLEAIRAVQRPTIHTRLILSIDRRNTPDEASEVIALAKRFHSEGVVAIDLCGDPAKGDVSHFTHAIREAKAAGLRVTIHFAEAECSASNEELQIIMGWDPDRLGHVIHVPKQVKRQIISRRGIGLELCLSCNVHAKMISGGFEAHHLGEWWHVESVVVVPCVSDSFVS